MSGAELIQQYINVSPEIAVGLELLVGYAVVRGGKEVFKRAIDLVMSNRERINGLLARENITLLEKDEQSAKCLEELNQGGIQKKKNGNEQAELFAEEKEPESEPVYPIQLDLFDADLNKRLEEDDGWRPPVPQILADGENRETALYLVSNFGLPEWNAKSIEAIRVARATRKALMKHFSLEELRVYMLFNATRYDLIDSLENPNIDHVIVRGHGNWSSWDDDSGFRTTSSFLSDNVDTDHKKKSFIRETCGIPLLCDAYEDQFGAEFSRETIGKATLTHVKDHAQIKHTLRQDFAKYKGMRGVIHDKMFEESQPWSRKIPTKILNWLDKLK